MSRKPSRDEITEAVLRVNVVLAKRTAALAHVAVIAAQATLAVHRFGATLRAAEQRDEHELLFAHPDVIEMDLADAYWRPQP